MGYLTLGYYRFPGFFSSALGLKFSDVPNGFTALSKVNYSSFGTIEGAFGFDRDKKGTNHLGAPGSCTRFLVRIRVQVCVRDPFGFWDPFGITSVGDVTAFRRRRYWC